MLGDMPALAESARLSLVALKSELSYAKRQIFVLQTENTVLRGDDERNRYMINLLLVEISILRAMHEAKKDGKNSRLTHSDGESMLRLEKQLSEYRSFVRALAEGHVFDPRTINHTQPGVDQGHDSDAVLVEAINAAAFDKESPWSKILPALVDGQVSEKYLSAVNLALKMHNDLREMQHLAQYWKSHAFSKSLSRLGSTASDSYLDNVGPEHAFAAPCSVPLTSNLDHPSTLADSQTNGVLHSATIPFPPGSESTGKRSTARSIRPSMSLELDAITNKKTLCSSVQMKNPKLPTFQELMRIKNETTEKRHGFVLPCIKSVLHAPAPAVIHSHNPSLQVSLESITPGPTASLNSPAINTLNSSDAEVTTPRMSQNTSRALQSAERLCAAFSSGSLGSLETTFQSESDTNASTHGSHPLEDAWVIDKEGPHRISDLPLLNRTCEHEDSELFQVETRRAAKSSVDLHNQTSTCFTGPILNSNPTTQNPKPQSGSKGPADDVVASSFASPADPSEASPLAPGNSTAGASRTSTKLLLQRVNWTCCSTGSKEAKVLHPQTPSKENAGLARGKAPGANAIRPTKQGSFSAGATPILKPSVPPTRQVAVTSPTGNTICAQKPRMSLIKTGLSKPAVPPRLVKNSFKSGPNPVLGRHRKWPNMSTNSSVGRQRCDEHIAMPTDGFPDVLTSTSEEHNNARSRLRVVNICDQDPKTPVRSSIQDQHQVLPQYRVNPWSTTGFQESSEYTRIDSGGRTAIGDPVISKSGLVRGVGRVSLDPHIKKQPSN